MAYEPDLETSNRIQRDAYAANPVSSRPVAPEPDPSVPALFRGESSATPPASGGGGLGGFLSNAIDERAAANLAARNAPAASNVVVTPEATQPRPAAGRVSYGNEGRGNGQPNVIADAVSSAPAQDVGQAVVPYDREATQAKLDVLNRRSDLRDAANEQGLRNSRTDQLASTDRLQAGQDLVRAESEARVARFRAVNGADVVLAGPGRRAASAELSKQAAAADANVAAIKGKATAPTVQTGNVLKDALDQREALTRGQLGDAASTRANAEAGLTDITGAVEKQKLDQQKRLNTLGQSLLSETDPKKRAAAEKNILTLMGKDPRKNYKTETLNLPGTVDPTTGVATSGGQALVIIGDDNTREVVRLDGGAAGKPGGDPTAEAKAAVAKGADRAKVNERLKAQGLPPI